jgi:serine/threonine protein kinase
VSELRLEDSVVDERYKLKRCLSRGSYAEIFIARDPERGDQEVIIKALNPFLQGTPDPLLEQTLVENFQNEAIALDKVRHPNIIRRLGHGTASDLEGTPFHYLVLEYMSGGDMLSLCRSHPIVLADTLFYFGQVAEGLSFAHSRNVIHRDIKPNNVLLSGDHQTVKIADFGVAKIATDDTAEITRVGTNIYAPPEHHPDNDSGALHQPLTPSADIYSLAKTIYTVLSGRAPHQFARRPVSALPDNIASERWAGALLPVLEKATSSSAADRYQSVTEFWQALAPLKSYLVDGGEFDDEATLVRPHGQGGRGARFIVGLKPGQAAAEHLSHAPRPNFQTVPRPIRMDVSARGEDAKIVVELPGRKAPAEAAAGLAEISKSEKKAGLLPPSDPRYDGAVTGGGPSPVPEGDNNFKTRPIASEAASAASFATTASPRPEVPAGRPVKSAAAVLPAEKGFFDKLRSPKGLEWLRRAFILFVILFIISLAAQTYLYFAGGKFSLRGIPGLATPYEEGAIFGATNVNIRSEPSGDVLTWLPAGTRVRILDKKGGWTRVKVLQWSGTPPVDAPDTGWVDGRFVKIDGK